MLKERESILGINICLGVKFGDKGEKHRGCYLVSSKYLRNCGRRGSCSTRKNNKE